MTENIKNILSGFSHQQTKEEYLIWKVLLESDLILKNPHLTIV